MHKNLRYSRNLGTKKRKHKFFYAIWTLGSTNASTAEGGGIYCRGRTTAASRLRVKDAARWRRRCRRLFYGDVTTLKAPTLFMVIW